MLCAYCGAECPSGNLYCGKCGRSLDLGESDSAPRYRPRQIVLRHEATILAAALLLIAATAFGIWYALFYMRSPEMVVRRFIDADLQNRFAAQNQYLVDRWDSRMVLSGFQAIRQHTGSSPFKDCQITGASQSGNTAYVNVVLKFTLPTVPGVNAPLVAPPLPPTPAAPPGPTLVPFAFVLSTENGQWKIDGSQTLANATGAFAAVGYTQFAPLLNGVPNLTLPNLGVPGGIPVPAAPPASPPPAGETTL